MTVKSHFEMDREGSGHELPRGTHDDERMLAEMGYQQELSL